MRQRSVEMAFHKVQALEIGRAEGNDQAAAGRELIDERLGQVIARSGDNDGLVRRLRRISQSAVTSEQQRVLDAELTQTLRGGNGKLKDDFDGDDPRAEASEDGTLVGAACPHLENLVSW